MWPTHYLPVPGRIEGVPPPRYYLTTPPYPLELTESLASTGDALAITPGIGTEDEIESTAAVIGGVLTALRVDLDSGREEIESTAAVISGVLQTVLVPYDNRHDELESTAAVISGVLTSPLIVYDNWLLLPDEIESSASVIGGVLA